VNPAVSGWRLGGNEGNAGIDEAIGTYAAGELGGRVMATDRRLQGPPASIDAAQERELKAQGKGASEIAKAFKIDRGRSARASARAVWLTGRGKKRKPQPPVGRSAGVQVTGPYVGKE